MIFWPTPAAQEGASPHIRLAINTAYRHIALVEFCRLFKEVETGSTRERISSSDWRTISAWQSFAKQSSRLTAEDRRRP